MDKDRITTGITYEQAVARLEEVIRQLEAGEPTLDESLQLFEEGIGLVRSCHRQLDAYEAKVQMLIDTLEGIQVEDTQVAEEMIVPEALFCAEGGKG
ncbi:MAG: exodeoxyribonuclease VII small subunit [Heliobacteriaceae bacterium]|nr:exodeoxyribonuclease VII small subunit [Heliobacteriaceae bacterium]MDD4587275.1 exodeoxyribonuclease VII small subunit [Heliobacteriaceae bacterium]